MRAGRANDLLALSYSTERCSVHFDYARKLYAFRYAHSAHQGHAILHAHPVPCRLSNLNAAPYGYSGASPNYAPCFDRYSNKYGHCAIDLDTNKLSISTHCDANTTASDSNSFFRCSDDPNPSWRISDGKQQC